MLPSELLVARIYGNKIVPRFARMSRENLGLAAEMINIFKTSIGRKRGEILDLVSEFEEGVNYRFVRGLRILLERRSVFEVKSRLNPVEVRRFVFEEASRAGGPVTSRGERRRILERVAVKLSSTVEEVEEALWADQETEQVLVSFSDVDPAELLRIYNLSLAQTMLFNAISLNVYVEGGGKEVLREVKYRGLMYLAEKQGKWVTITIDGPASLLKMTERYGTSMAKILPSVITSGKWAIRANVVRKGADNKPRIYEFTLSYRDNYLLKTREREEVKFDSMVEEDFYRAFQSLGTDWVIKRESEPLLAGKTILVPDFTLEKGPVKVYLEIVGFWTDEYVKRKLEKLGKVEENVILAVDEELACSSFQRYRDVIYYRKKIPLKPLIEILRRYEVEALERSARSLELERYVPDKDVIRLDEVADAYGVSVESVKERLHVEGYRVIGSLLISEQVLEAIKGELESKPERSRLEAEAILKRYGVGDFDLVLDALGFKTVWPGVIDPKKAKVVRK